MPPPPQKNSPFLPKIVPGFSKIAPAIMFLPTNMHTFLESGWLLKSSHASEFLILRYGKMSNFRGGTLNLSIKPERGTVDTIMFHSGQGVEWYQAGPDSLPPWKVIPKNPQYLSFLNRL